MSPAKKKLTRRLILWVGLPALVILVAAAVAFSRKKEATMFTAKVERGNITSIVTATGTINAVTSVLVGSQVSGTIQYLYADFNSRVQRGQKVAQLEPSLFKARYDQAIADLENSKANLKSLEVQVDVQRADVAAARANVAKARAGQVQAGLDLKRAVDLFKQGIVAEALRDSAQATADSAQASLAASQAQLQQSEARLKSQQAQVEQARAQVSQREAAARASKVDLDHATILAPINGTVVARNVDVGQTVAASLQAPTLFTIAEDLSKMLVYVKTDESDVGNVRVGGRADFRVDAFPRDTFSGHIKEVRINPTTVQNVVTYDTVIEFENPEQKLLPGMTAYVTIPVAMANNVLKVPNGAIRFRPDLTEEERQAALKKAGIEMPSAGAGRRGMAPDGEKGAKGGGGGMRAGANGEAKGQGTSGNGERRAMGGGGGGMRAGGRGPSDVQVIWAQTSEKDMRPVMVRTSITDYTYTAVLEVLKGDLKEGDLVVTGMSIPNRASTGQFGGPGMGGPRPGMGGPGMGGPGMRPAGR